MPGFTLKNTSLRFIFRVFFQSQESWFKMQYVFITWSIYFSLYDTFPFLLILWYSTAFRNCILTKMVQEWKRKQTGKWDFPYKNTTFWPKASEASLNIAKYNECAVESQVSLQLLTSSGIWNCIIKATWNNKYLVVCIRMSCGTWQSWCGGSL